MTIDGILVKDQDETNDAEFEEETLVTPRFKLNNYPADTTLSGYVLQYEKGQLQIPKFQRGYVWDPVRASKLIESFLMGLPVPNVFLYKESTNYQIIDGQQRIFTVLQFFKGKFLDSNKEFRLKKVAEPWEGKTFEELDDESRFKLEEAILRSIIIQQVEPDDGSAKYSIFERLNTGTSPLTPMQIRKCVYESPLIEKLVLLNENTNWRLLYGRDLLSKDTKDMKDVELLLRVFALFEASIEYKRPMKGFLNSYALKQKNNFIHERQACDEKFNITIEKMKNLLLDLATQVKGPLLIKRNRNVAYIEALLVTLLKENSVPFDYEGGLLLLEKNERFMTAISESTSNEGAVISRLEECKKCFFPQQPHL
jgi:Protein of unknown function DUF262